MTKPQRATPHARGQFQSTPSVWRETTEQQAEEIAKNISIHSLRVEGDEWTEEAKRMDIISIHSLRVEGANSLTASPTLSMISIHSLRVEGDSSSC